MGLDKDFDKKVNRLAKIAITLTVLSGICIVIFWLCAAALLFKGCEEVEKRGLKSIVNQVWEGSSKGDTTSK